VIIFVHIPKTAGTTFKNIIVPELKLKREEIIVVESQGWNAHTSRMIVNERPGLNGTVTLKPDPTIKLVSGHFKADKFKPIYPDATYITWIREPIERLISSYYYYLLLDPCRYGNISKVHREYDMIDLEYYVTRPFFSNCMTSQLNIPLDNFKFVGITEHFDKEIARYDSIMGTNMSSNKNYNANNINPAKPNYQEKYKISDDLRQKLIELNREDYELYNKCLKIAGY
jgi:hypothetical protein